MPDTTPFLLPSYANSAGANTAVLTDNNGAVLDNYWKNAEMQYKNKVFDYQKKQKEIEDAAAAVNFDTKGMLPADEGAIRKGIFDLIDFVDKHPDAASPNSDLYPEFKKMHEDLDLGIHKSQEDYVRWVGNLDGISKGTFDPEHKTEVDQWASPTKDLTEIQNRQPLNLIPSPDNNIMTLAAAVEKDLTTGTKASTTAHKDQFGQIVNDTTTEQQIDLSRLPDEAKTIYQTDRSWKAQADRTFASLTPEQKAQYGNDPSNVLVDLLLPHINAKVDQKQSFRTDWMSQFETRQQQQNPQIRFVAQDAADIANPQSDIWTPVTKKGGEGDIPFFGKNAQAGNYFMTTKFKGTLVTDPTADRGVAPVVKIYRDKDGTLYARTTASTNYKDFVKVTPDQLIKDYWNQNTSGVAGENEVDQSLNMYQTLKGGGTIQAPPTTTSTSSGKTQSNTQYSKEQEAGIQAVMAKNPNATREEIIKALQDAGKLPK